MKFHKNYNTFITVLSEIFPRIPKIDVVYRNIKILRILLDNNNSASAEELAYDSDILERRIRVKLRELENEGFITHKKEKKSNESYKKNYYSSILKEKIIKRIEKYTICYSCGSTFAKYGGIVHNNICSDESIKIFCSIGCRDRWCYDDNRK